ncbi:MAG: coproporphyrinogen III oxidase [Methylococcales bacterium]|nr:coproporphyrinogen III oxidase [Methylococcales bacterium]
MNRTKAQSIKAETASHLVEELQHYFVKQLNEIDTAQQDKQSFTAIEWFRDEGTHGGGVRYVATNQQLFNRASVNVSQVQYDDDANKSLASATALSTIIHPENPHAPSVHMHISWTEMKTGQGYWRMMADLNPAIENQQATALFSETLKNVADKQYPLAKAQGDRYFYIPALERHRGVSHFYLEQYNSGDELADINLAKTLGRSVIDCYVELFKQAIVNNPNPSVDDYDKQKAYHTLYLFQVLTLDRGTTSGLLVHDQNDQGIMGSLPAQIDKTLLASWQKKLSSPQDLLLVAILKALPNESPCLIDENVKLALASAVRQHYKKYPQALAMQARGNSIPATVENHTQ